MRNTSCRNPSLQHETKRELRHKSLETDTKAQLKRMNNLHVYLYILSVLNKSWTRLWLYLLVYLRLVILHPFHFHDTVIRHELYDSILPSATAEILNILTDFIFFASCSRDIEAWLASYTMVVDHAQSLIFTLLTNIQIASVWHARSSRQVPM